MKTNKQGRAYKPGVVDRLAGQRFGLLKVIERAGNVGKFAAWRCRCDCGAEVIAGGNKLRNGRRKACGINGHRFKAEHDPGITTVYKSEYQSWRNMHSRCNSSSHKNYPNYGARGITICPEWKSFEVFLRDMGRKPDPKFTIERDDTNGHYVPGNCRWASREDQHRNKRNSVYVM